LEIAATDVERYEMSVTMTAPPPATKTRSRRWPPLQGEWTYEDYLRLPDNGMRYEVIKGDLCMSPPSRPLHQECLGALCRLLHQQITQRPGQILLGPVALVLPGYAEPVQPDLLFIAQDRLAIVQETIILGVPDMIAEVLSPESVYHDRRRKFELYARAGVREYWLVDPAGTIEIYVLRGQAYAPLGSFTWDDALESELWPELTAAVNDILPVGS
jgi:Uma2 family endonuclease